MGGQPPQALMAFLARAKRLAVLERVILFGSRARGVAKTTSDYDVIFVSQAFEGQPFYARPVPFLLLWEEPQDLELLCYTPAEFEAKRAGINVVATAVREGLDIAA